MKNTFLEVLTIIVTVGELLLLGLMLYIWRFGASTVDQGVVNLIYGLGLGYHSAFMLVMGYWFGSSKGSADKTAIMNQAGQTVIEKATDKPVQ